MLNLKNTISIHFINLQILNLNINVYILSINKIVQWVLNLVVHCKLEKRKFQKFKKLCFGIGCWNPCTEDLVEVG